MSGETEKKNLVDYFILGISIVYIIVVLLIAYAANLSNNSLGNKLLFLLSLI